MTTTPSPPPLAISSHSRYIGKVFQNNKIQAVTNKSRHQRIMTIK